MRLANTTLHLHDPDQDNPEMHIFGPGDELPDWVLEIPDLNPDLLVMDDEFADVSTPVEAAPEAAAATPAADNLDDDGIPEGTDDVKDQLIKTAEGLGMVRGEDFDGRWGKERLSAAIREFMDQPKPDDDVAGDDGTDPDD